MLTDRRIPRRRLLCLALLGICAGLPVRAAEDPGLVRLRGFLAEVRTLRATFTQEVTDSDGELVERATGHVVMQRPGRFRWDYQVPFERVIVADGERLSLYEADLAQVTVRRLADGLGDTPAALLTGRRDVLERFDVRRSWREDGLQWVALVPKAGDADFAGVVLGFEGSLLRVLRLDDRFGQRTKLVLDEVVTNIAIAPGTFTLEVPDDVDVIDDTAL